MGCFLACFGSKNKKRRHSAAYVSPVSNRDRVLHRNIALPIKDEDQSLATLLPKDKGNLEIVRKPTVNPRWARKLECPGFTDGQEEFGGKTEVAGDKNKEKNALAEVDELAKELVDLTRIIQSETEDVQKFMLKVKSRQHRSRTPVTPKQTPADREDNLVAEPKSAVASEEEHSSVVQGTEKISVQDSPPTSQQSLSTSRNTQPEEYSSSSSKTVTLYSTSENGASSSTPYESMTSYSVGEATSEGASQPQSLYTESEVSMTDSAPTQDESSENLVTTSSYTTSNVSTTAATHQRPSRYHGYQSGDEEEDEEYDSMLYSEDSCAPDDCCSDDIRDSRDSIAESSEFSSLARQQADPPLMKLDYTPQKPGHDYTATNNNCRIRSQYVYPVLNPVNNLSQWNALKRDGGMGIGSSQEFIATNISQAERMYMMENMAAAAEKKQHNSTSPTTLFPKPPTTPVSCNSTAAPPTTPAMASATKQDSAAASCRRKLIPSSEEPVFKESKARNRASASPEVEGTMLVDASLSHWLKPNESQPNNNNSNSGGEKENQQKPDRQVEPKYKDVARVLTECSDFGISPGSATSERSVMAMAGGGGGGGGSLMSPATPPTVKSSPCKNFDDRPILGALSVENIKQAALNKAQSSPRRSASSSELDNRPILGAASYTWNDKQRNSPLKKASKPKYAQVQRIGNMKKSFETAL